MDKKEQQRMAQKALYEKRKKEEEAQEKRRVQHAKHNKKRRTPQKQRTRKTKNKIAERARKDEDMKEKMIEEQEEHIRELDRERQRKLRQIKKQLESVEKIHEYGIIGETVERFYRNTGAIENEVPPPPSEEETKSIIKEFSHHVCPHFHRCQGCGQETLSSDDDEKYHRVKVFLKNKLNPTLEHLQYNTKVVGRRGKFCHQINYNCDDMSVWLAVCEPCKPQNIWEKFVARLSPTVKLCDKCYANTNWCGFKKFDIGKYPLNLWKIQNGLHKEYTKLNALEAMCLSSRILFYKLVKLSKSGDGLKGAIINLASNLNEKVPLPRKDACKYISATIIGEKVNKTTSLKYPSYLANKEIQGLKANLDKLKLFYQLIPEEYRDGNVDWDNLQTEVKDSSILNDTSIESILSEKTVSNSQTRENFIGGGEDSMTEVFAAEHITNLTNDEVVVPKLAELMGIENVEGNIRSGFMNEISMMGEILQETFTYLFPLDPIDSGLSLKKIVKYLMQFYDKRFRKCNGLIMYLFDTIRRFDCFNATNYRLKATTEQDAEFISAMNDPELKAKLKKAVSIYNQVATARDQLAAFEGQAKNLRTDAQREQMDQLQMKIQTLKSSEEWTIFKSLNKRISRMTHLTQPKIKWSVPEREALLPVFYSYRDMFGSGNFWITLTCQVYNSRLAFRLTLPNGVDKEEITIDLYNKSFKDNKDRFQEIGKDSAARAETFRIIIDAILIHLFGMPYSTISKTTMDFKATKGLWGNARAYVAVIEATGTGLLHAHVLLWSFLHVALIRKMLADEAKRNEITAFIDKTVSAKFDHLVHAKYEQYGKKTKEIKAEKRQLNGKIHGFQGTKAKIVEVEDEIANVKAGIHDNNNNNNNNNKFTEPESEAFDPAKRLVELKEKQSQLQSEQDEIEKKLKKVDASHPKKQKAFNPTHLRPPSDMNRNDQLRGHFDNPNQRYATSSTFMHALNFVKSNFESLHIDNNHMVRAELFDPGVREMQLVRLENLYLVNIDTCGFRVCRDSFVDSFVVTDFDKLKSFAGDLVASDRHMLLTFVNEYQECRHCLSTNSDVLCCPECNYYYCPTCIYSALDARDVNRAGNCPGYIAGKGPCTHQFELPSVSMDVDSDTPATTTTTTTTTTAAAAATMLQPGSTETFVPDPFYMVQCNDHEISSLINTAAQEISRIKNAFVADELFTIDEDRGRTMLAHQGDGNPNDNTVNDFISAVNTRLKSTMADCAEMDSDDSDYSDMEGLFGSIDYNMNISSSDEDETEEHDTNNNTVNDFALAKAHAGASKESTVSLEDSATSDYQPNPTQDSYQYNDFLVPDTEDFDTSDYQQNPTQTPEDHEDTTNGRALFIATQVHHPMNLQAHRPQDDRQTMRNKINNSKQRFKREIKQKRNDVQEHVQKIDALKTKLLLLCVKRRGDQCAQKIMHRHTHTCLHGKMGHYQCRMAYLRAVAAKTGFKEVELKLEKDGSLIFVSTTGDKIICDVDSNLAFHSPGISELNLDFKPDEALPPKDTTALVLDTCRPTEKDQKVVSHNKIAHGLLGDNIDATCLGDETQAKAVMMYLTNYSTTKSSKKQDTPHTLNMCLSARQSMDIKQSTAKDAGEEKRNALYLLQKLTNSMVNATEMSAEQMAASVLGMDAHYLTIEPFYLFAWQAVDQIRQQKEWAHFPKHKIITRTDNQYHYNLHDDVGKNVPPDEEGIPVACAFDPIDFPATNSSDENDVGSSDNHASLNKPATVDNDEDEDVDIDRVEHDDYVRASQRTTRGLRSIGINENNTVITSSQYEHWLYRGDALQHLDLYTYCGTILVRNMYKNEKPMNDDDIVPPANTSGRKKNPVFYFRPSYKEHKMKIQQIRSKFVAPLRIGRHRPPYPIKKASETKTAFENRRLVFAQYFSAILLPCGVVGEGERDPFIEAQWELGHSWNGFCAIVEGWKNDYVANMNQELHKIADCPSAAETGPCTHCLTVHKIHNIGRWHVYNNMTRGMCTRPIQRKIQLKYRSRATVPWNEMDPDEVPVKLKKRTSNDDYTNAQLKAQHEQNMTQDAIDPTNQRKYRKQYLYHKRLNDITDFLKVVKTPPLPKSRSKHSRKVNYKNRISVKRAENMLAELMEKADGNIALPRIDRDSSEFSDPVEKPPPELDNFHDQRVTFKYCLKTLSSGEQLLCLINGGPGTGKTYLQRKIVDRVLKRLNMGVKGCALQGSAAVLMHIGDKSGETMHTTFSIDLPHKRKNANHLKVLYPILETVDLLIMDEVSMTSARHFAQIHDHLKEALNMYRVENGNNSLPHLDVDKPFLGKHFIVLGDFNQIPPIGAASLNTAMVQLCVSQKLSAQRSAELKLSSLAGAILFKQFTAKFLTQQVRSSSDPEHTAFIESFSTVQNPITMQRIRGIQDYTEQLVQDNPAFELAPVLVSTNNERHFWNEKRALQMGKKAGIRVIKFYNPHRLASGGYEEINKAGIPPTSRNQEIDNKRKGFSSYFVHGAPGILTGNVKSKKSKSTVLANGQPCRYYSLTFPPKFDALVDKIYDEAPTDGFHVLTLPQPKYIHVFIDGELEVQIGNSKLTVTNSNLERQMNPNHHVNDIVYVLWSDLFLKNHSTLQKWKGYKKAKITKINKQGFIYCATYSKKYKKNDPVRRMEVCLGFSFTMNKCQGMTLPCVILSIANVPGFCMSIIRLAHLYVALSRVIAGRYLAKLPGTDEQFEYLTKLSYPPTVTKWKNNYDEHGRWKDGMVDVDDIVQRLQSLESLGELETEELKDIGKMLGEAVYGLKRSDLMKMLLPWFQFAHDSANTTTPNGSSTQSTNPTAPNQVQTQSNTHDSGTATTSNEASTQSTNPTAPNLVQLPRDTTGIEVPMIIDTNDNNNNVNLPNPRPIKRYRRSNVHSSCSSCRMMMCNCT